MLRQSDAAAKDGEGEAGVIDQEKMNQGPQNHVDAANGKV